MCPPIEHPEAITDEDSDEEETGNPDRFPRRLLNAAAEFSKTRSGPLTGVHLKPQGPQKRLYWWWQRGQPCDYQTQDIKLKKESWSTPDLCWSSRSDRSWNWKEHRRGGWNSWSVHRQENVLYPWSLNQIKTAASMRRGKVWGIWKRSRIIMSSHHLRSPTAM